jgi:hypothetical protein
MGNMFRLIIKSSSGPSCKKTYKTIPDEPGIDNSVCKAKKRLLHLRNKELRYTKTDITPYHPNPILIHNSEITKPAFIIFIIFLMSYLI